MEVLRDPILAASMPAGIWNSPAPIRKRANIIQMYPDSCGKPFWRYGYAGDTSYQLNA